MFEHRKLQSLDDYFLEYSRRTVPGVYFYRLCGYNQEIQDFILKYYEAARRTGVVIEGKIPNPEERHLAYYEEIMGLSFQMDAGFIDRSLKKWLPRMKDKQRSMVATSIYDVLDAMHRDGKNENMLRNAYIKFMCWLYYRFERIVNCLGEETLPKILYEGMVSNYELKLLSILSKAGCDIVLLQYQDDAAYLKLDAASALSDRLELPGLGAFSPQFSIKWLRGEIEKQNHKQKLYGALPQVVNCTNAWIEGKGLTDILKEPSARGDDARFFYNSLIRIKGVEDKVTYLNELYQFQLSLKNSGRRFLVLEHTIPRPTTDEIQSVSRKNYVSTEQMLLDLSREIRYTASIELEKLMRKALIDILLEEAKKPDSNVNRLTNKAVYLLCWLKRYAGELFATWRRPQIACFVYLGGCQNENEAMFLRFLARLPVDVLILLPNQNTVCCLEDKNLYDINYPLSLAVEHFPREDRDVRMGTAAFHAEQELDEIMYQNSGLYRNQQYEKAVSVSLQTMYEEIAILWDQEIKYRPNFSVVDAVVNVPVIFAKVSGVKDGQTAKYWSDIRALATPDTLVIREAPYINPTDPNPMKTFAAGFFKNGKLLKTKIKEHASYPYSFLREEVQDHILEKLQLLIQQKLIKGTFENGTEYTIIATVLNLNTEVIRLMQKFDFTKKNPKVLYIHTTEKIISLEDSILTAFLNLVGFDVVFFVPTGYQNIERHFNRMIIEEHQIGEYMYDLRVPTFGTASPNTRRSWREILFKRGD